MTLKDREEASGVLAEFMDDFGGQPLNKGASGSASVKRGGGRALALMSAAKKPRTNDETNRTMEVATVEYTKGTASVSLQSILS